MAVHNFDSNNVKPRCTLITDASWCPDTKAAGFGGWCAGSSGSGKVGGAIMEQLPTSQVAEAVAVCNAVWMSMDKGLLLPNAHLLIQIDNQNVIKLYNDLALPSNNHEKKAVEWFNAFMKKYGISYRFKYIKAHHVSGESKHYCHNLCDQEAKTFMRHRRSQIRLQQMREIHGLGKERNPDAVSDKFKQLVIRETREMQCTDRDIAKSLQSIFDRAKPWGGF